MSDIRLDTYLHYGTNAERIAFVPDPPNPAISQPSYIWFETDTLTTWLYYTAWVQIAGGAIGSVVQISTVVLTDADIKALPTTPFELVAAPGASNRIVLVQSDFYLDSSAGAYTNIDDASWAALQINSIDISNYLPDNTGPAGTKAKDLFSVAHTCRLLLVQRGLVDIIGGWGVVPFQTDPGTDLINQPLVFFLDNAAAGNFTGGNAANTLTINTLYHILP